MNSYKIINKTEWPRSELFDFYQTFNDPCFHVSVSLDGQRLYEYAKGRGESFFLLTLYAILRAANLVPQMRQRVMGGDIIEFDQLAVMTPIMTGHEMFRQIWCEYAPDFAAFAQAAAPEAAAARGGNPAPLKDHGQDFLCASCLPWLHFTSISQAALDFHQAVPILGWGQLKDGKIPMSGKFNHAFVDGLHVARFYWHIEQCLARPESLMEPAEEFTRPPAGYPGF
ncbi:CatA-like O-acetyltransferase [Deltaproteobacteria bacterium Smac51]|nr:CatA-like O-acetyltransferase [Deltaproteobacteria bacterium Smac51]